MRTQMRVLRAEEGKALCQSCSLWVDCGRDGRRLGFCMALDLFTYTARTTCLNYVHGVPATEEEWEESQGGRNGH